MEIEPVYGVIKKSLKYKFFDMDLINPINREISEREIELMGGEGWEIINITDAIKIGKKHFIRIFVKKIE